MKFLVHVLKHSGFAENNAFTQQEDSHAPVSKNTAGFVVNAWESGKMYSAPRESISDLISRADCRKYGVYLLLSERQVYVGQAVDLGRRTKQHLTDKDWWNQVVLMTTKDDSFNSSDIDYLESRLIFIAAQAGTSDSDNRTIGNRQKVDEFRQAELEQYLEEALFLLELIGVRVFKKETRKARIPVGRPSILDTPIPQETGTSGGQGKPALPNASLGPCTFAKTALTALMASGYIFTDEQMNAFGSVEGSREYTLRNLPMFWILKDGESRATCEKKIRSRYWKEEFVSGGYRFLAFSQWYEQGQHGAHKENFISWYNSL